MYFRPISLQLEVGPKPHPKDADGSVTPAEGPWKSIATPPITEPQTFAFVKIDLGPCNPLVLDNSLFHSLYILAAGYKDCDVISERRNPCRQTASKQDTVHCRTCPLITKPAQEGLQREDIEKRRQRAALPDLTLDRDHPRTPSVHLHHCLRVVVHHANPSAELQFESGSLQSRRYEPMVYPNEGLGLI